MWPWEHAAFGYVLVSILTRLVSGRGPQAASAGLVVFGSLLPDLIDKPLSWSLRLFESGYAIGHSALVAVPGGLALLLVGYRRGRGRLVAAFVVGYWSHLAGDLLAPYLAGRGVQLGRVLWPVAAQRPYATHRGLIDRTMYYLGRTLDSPGALTDPEIALRFFGVPALVGLLWLLDGAPGVPGALKRGVRRVAFGDR